MYQSYIGEVVLLLQLHNSSKRCGCLFSFDDDMDDAIYCLYTYILLYKNSLVWTSEGKNKCEWAVHVAA